MSSELENEERLRYRLFTGSDDRAFCQRVSAALDEGYTLYGSPSITYGPDGTKVAQGLILAD